MQRARVFTTWYVYYIYVVDNLTFKLSQIIIIRFMACSHLSIIMTFVMYKCDSIIIIIMNIIKQELYLSLEATMESQDFPFT